ncbi:MAG: DNA-directed RNA polymerase subunit omega [Flavobacteriales bacterium]|nr:DNA-directed RNA polymerase subunit omega [Flavobacteriales bacterium]
MDYKKTNAAKTTVTRNTIDLRNRVDGNIYEAIVVLSRRANQISKGMKEELHSKLQEFASHQDNLEEIFENREQIEISKFYERLPKPHSIALQEMMEEKIYFRHPEKEITDPTEE